jgi:hypothetical protein
MRRTRFLLAASVALAVSGCAREAQYVEQQVSPPANVPQHSAVGMYSSSPASAQQAYEHPPLPPESQKASASNRGLLTSRSLTADAAARPAAQSFSRRRWYPTSANDRQFLKQPPSATSEAQSSPDNNRGLFRSRWAGIYAEQPAQETQAPVKRIDSSPRAPAQQADDQTGSLPPESRPPSDNSRGLFTSRTAAPNSTAQPAPRRPASAASMYTSSPAKAQQAYE